MYSKIQKAPNKIQHMYKQYNNIKNIWPRAKTSYNVCMRGGPINLFNFLDLGGPSASRVLFLMHFVRGIRPGNSPRGHSNRAARE